MNKCSDTIARQPLLIKKKACISHYRADNAKAENTVGQKIEGLRHLLGLSQVDLRVLLEEYGVSVHKDIIGRWERGDTIPTCYQLLAICHALSVPDGVSFFSGKQELNEVGIRKLLEYKKDLISTGLYSPIEKRWDIEYIEMPISYLSVSAGTGSFLDEGNFEKISVPKSKVPENAEFGIRVSGDSMEPTYSDGQLVWIQTTQDLSPGEVGIFIYGDQGYMKLYSIREPEKEFLSKYLDINGQIRSQPVLISFNKKYDPIIVSPEIRFQIVGRVLD